LGLFHCPVGCAYYEDDPCIDCLLCLATNEEERVQASRRIRQHLKSRAEARRGPIRKIAVCGKGGTGKTTVVALLAHAFRDLGLSVLVLDLDESNPGLRKLLGFHHEPAALTAAMERGTRETGWLRSKEIRTGDIPPEYVQGDGSLKFLMAGKITDAFQGCACSLSDAARELLERLVLGDGEVLLLDTEAGVESFGRGVERYVDAVVIMAEPSSESLALAEKISYLAEGIGVRRIWAIPNKIPTEDVARRIEEAMGKRKIELLGTLYLDPEVSGASLEGTVPPAGCEARNAVNGMARRLIQEDFEPA